MDEGVPVKGTELKFLEARRQAGTGRMAAMTEQLGRGFWVFDLCLFQQS